MNLALVLKLYRSSLGIGVRELADALGISAATVSRIENGSKPDLDTWFKIEEWLFAKAEMRVVTRTMLEELGKLPDPSQRGAVAKLEEE